MGATKGLTLASVRARRRGVSDLKSCKTRRVEGTARSRDGAVSRDRRGERVARGRRDGGRTDGAVAGRRCRRDGEVARTARRTGRRGRTRRRVARDGGVNTSVSVGSQSVSLCATERGGANCFPHLLSEKLSALGDKSFQSVSDSSRWRLGSTGTEFLHFRPWGCQKARRERGPCTERGMRRPWSRRIRFKSRSGRRFARSVAALFPRRRWRFVALGSAPVNG